PAADVPTREPDTHRCADNRCASMPAPSPGARSPGTRPSSAPLPQRPGERSMSSPQRSILRVSRTLGDSLVELHHIDPAAPDDGGRRRWILVAVGAACLLVSLLAFARGVSLAAENKRALIHHIEVERR